jgi:hypothetical protein
MQMHCTSRTHLPNQLCRCPYWPAWRRRALCLGLVALGLVTLTSTPAQGRAPIKPPTRLALSIAEAQTAIREESVQGWDTPGVEAHESACLRTGPESVRCEVTWSDPAWQTDCGPLTISGEDEAVRSSRVVTVYAV